MAQPSLCFSQKWGCPTAGIQRFRPFFLRQGQGSWSHGFSLISVFREIINNHSFGIIQSLSPIAELKSNSMKHFTTKGNKKVKLIGHFRLRIALFLNSRAPIRNVRKIL